MIWSMWKDIHVCEYCVVLNMGLDHPALWYLPGALNPSRLVSEGSLHSELIPWWWGSWIFFQVHFSIALLPLMHQQIMNKAHHGSSLFLVLLGISLWGMLCLFHIHISFLWGMKCLRIKVFHFSISDIRSLWVNVKQFHTHLRDETPVWPLRTGTGWPVCRPWLV